MTAEEKKALSALMDAAEDRLLGGRRTERPECRFEDDPSPDSAAAETLRASLPDASGENTADPEGALRDLAAGIRACAACGLSKTRNLAAPGEGVSRPLVLVIGEGPGRDEDASGRPFVGRAGQLLDKMLAAINLSRQKNCFIANIVKCRPPDADGRDRPPTPEEISGCIHFLEKQIEILSPEIILCAGRVSAQTMLGSSEGIGKLRGRFGVYRVKTGGGEKEIPLLATYHPSALLRDETYKRPAWEDMKMLRARLAEIDRDYAAGIEEHPPL